MARKVRAMIFLCVMATLPLAAQAELEIAFPNLSFDHEIDLQHAGDGSNKLYVVEQDGIIHIFDNDVNATASVFMDIETRVDNGGYEEGLLGLAFHPEYADSGYFYVNYTTNGPNMTRISRFSRSDANPDQGDPDSELILMEIERPFENHNAGQIAFGPDGYLYIGTGDGGSGGDPQCHGVDRGTYLAAMLRIDVDHRDDGLNYAIPADNPFVGNSNGYLEEIFAWGLRNPWKFSFDAQTGLLWCADVGQNAWEEISIIENGKFYGWNIMEGFHGYNDSGNCTDSLGPGEAPVWEYSHSLGSSISGGYVYYGANNPELYGKYIYADYISGRIWALEYDGITPPQNELLIDTSFDIPGFGVDEQGELYVLTFDSGRIRRFVPTATGDTPAIGFSETMLDFEGVNVGEDSTMDLTITNIGSVTLNVTSLAVDDPEEEFSVFPNGPLTIEEGASEVVQVTFAPLFVAEAEGLLVIESDAANNPSATIGLIGFGENVVGVDGAGERPSAYMLHDNYPDPFNPTTSIRFETIQSGEVQLAVFDLQGQLIRTLVSATQPAGVHEVIWDGVDDFGNSVSSGVYFYRLRAGSNFVSTKKMILMK